MGEWGDLYSKVIKCALFLEVGLIIAAFVIGLGIGR